MGAQWLSQIDATFPLPQASLLPAGSLAPAGFWGSTTLGILPPVGLLYRMYLAPLAVGLVNEPQHQE